MIDHGLLRNKGGVSEFTRQQHGAKWLNELGKWRQSNNQIMGSKIMKTTHIILQVQFFNDHYPFQAFLLQSKYDAWHIYTNVFWIISRYFNVNKLTS